MDATYGKLKDGSWGLRVDGVPGIGGEVTVAKRDGTTRVEVVGSILWQGITRSGKPGALCTIAGTRKEPLSFDGSPVALGILRRDAPATTTGTETLSRTARARARRTRSQPMRFVPRFHLARRLYRFDPDFTPGAGPLVHFAAFRYSDGRRFFRLDLGPVVVEVG